MQRNIRNYQQEIIDTIKKRMENGIKEIFIEMAPGTGKSIIIKNLIENMNPKDKVLLLTSAKLLETQYINIFKDCNNIEVRLCQNRLVNRSFDYVILSETEKISEQEYQNIIEKFSSSTFIFFSDSTQRIKSQDNWLEQKKKDYTITTKEAISYGYINPKQGEIRFQLFVEKLLQKLQLTNIEREVALHHNHRIARIDFVARNKNRKIIIEVKSYRNKFVQNNIINQAIEQVASFKNGWEKANNEIVEAILITSSFISDEIKEKYYNDYNIMILDISNLLYLSQDDDELIKQLVESVQYDITSIIPRETVFVSTIEEGKNKAEPIDNVAVALNFIERLEKIKPGKDDSQDKEYENVCIEIIKYLFESEFTKMASQNDTEDKMFRMDLVCGLKGTSEIWKIFIQHYNTRFIVFEFKNYKEEIDQNLIYITEKYLYNAALRNVAIIISRKGFSHNARKAGTGILTESGKLIIDIKDSDIITMLRMKADGQDAADYMLNILEDYLMSISK